MRETAAMKKKIIFLLGILCVISLLMGDSKDQEKVLTESSTQVAAMLEGAGALVPINISKSGGSNESANVVAVNNQKVYAIWVSYGRGKSIQFNTNESGSWATPYSISNGTTVGHSGPWPYFAMDKNGHPHIVFTAKFSGGNYEVSHNSYSGQWTGNINVSRTYEGGSACPTIAVNPVNNERYVCWYDDEGHPDRWELFFKVQSPNGSWSNQTVLPFGMSHYTPKMAVDGRGTGHLIWLRRRKGGSFIHYSNNPNPANPSSWTQDVEITGNTNIDFAEISIAADEAGNVFVVYEQKNAGNYEIYFKTKSPGGGWSSAQNISKTGKNSKWPDVAAMGGKAYVVWQELTGNWQIFFRHYANGGWTGASDMTNNQHHSIQPSVWIDADGEIHVVYSDKTTGNYNIWYLSSKDTGGVPISAVYPPLNVRLNTSLEGSTEKKKNVVKWKKNSDNDHEAVEKYRLYRKQTNQGASAYSVRATIPKGVYMYEDIGLSRDYKYTYVVTTIDNRGEESEYSNEVTEPLVFPPVNISVNSDLDDTKTKKINTVKWQRNSKNGGTTVKKYIVYRKVQDQGTYQSIGSISGSTYTYVDKNLATGKKYAYRLTAVDTGSRECEPSLSGYEYYVFCPINMNLKTIKNEGIFFSEKINRYKWKKSPLNDPVTVVRYNVYRKKKEEKKSAYVRIFVVDTEPLEIWDRNLPLDQKYSYAVTAVCENGAESGFSNSRSEQ
jgi:fibronectin type 3 domain-containing protein